MALAALLVVPGCIGDGLLIKPVSTKQRLVETVLARDSILATDKIALIDVTGVMVNAGKVKLLGRGEHPVSLLLEQLDKARKDRAVKAVILRINSPGGTVTAAELMHDELERFRKHGKPVVAVMMDVAASGGYYIACACDEIVAMPSTVTGSIGVVMHTFNVSETMSMVGVSQDAITSGKYKDTGSPFRAMRPEEREILQGIVNDMYERFVGVVVDGRPQLDEAAVRKLADGRVYTANQALKLGLIDRIATMREAIALCKKRSGARRIRLVAYHRPHGYRPNYYLQRPHTTPGDVNLLKLDLPAWPALSTARFMYLWSPGIY
jgi:protease-4